MRILSSLRQGTIAAVIVIGLALFAASLQGVARIDTSLELAASRSTPDRALVEETADDRDCPYGDRRDRV
jgi:hypothetical protein